MMQDPISVWTAVAYGLVGVVLLAVVPSLETAVFAAALVALTVGTMAYHYDRSERGRSLDHGTMNATYLALLVYALGGEWWAMLAAALAGLLVVEYRMDHPNRVLMGVCVGGTFVAMGAVGLYGPLVAAVLLMGVGFALWHLRSDLAHGLGWHLLTAVGTGTMYWSLAMVGA